MRHIPHLSPPTINYNMHRIQMIKFIRHLFDILLAWFPLPICNYRQLSAIQNTVKIRFLKFCDVMVSDV